MKKNIFHILSILLLTLCFISKASAQTVLSPPPHSIITLEGNYMNTDMYIQNPKTNYDSGFCVFMCVVNNKYVDSINSSAFIIPLTKMGFKEGDSLKIEIYHHEDCKPKVIYNSPPPKNPVEFTDVTVDSNYVLHFKTKGEAYKYTYIIEQFRWNKWVKIGEVEGKGIYEGAEYSFQVTPHSGENQVRVKYYSWNNQPYYIKPVKFISNVPDVSTDGKCKDSKIGFTLETMYEVYDNYNNIVKKGFGIEVDITGLPAGIYYLNYDNKSMEFIIPKKKN